MKLIIITIAVIFLAISTNSAPTCPDVYGKGETKTSPIDIKTQVYLADQKENKEFAAAAKNALDQTVAARKLFYKPNPQAIGLIKLVAKNLIGLYKKSKENTDGFKAFINTTEQRQTTSAGTIQEYFNQSIKENFSKITVKTTVTPKENALGKLMDNMANPSPNDTLGFLGLLGDFGAAIQDTFGRKAPSADQKTFAELIKKSIKNLDAKSAEIYSKYSPDNFYDSPDKKAQTKPGERKTCAKSKDEAKPNLAPRAGVMDTGAAADKQINPTKALIAVGWPWQTVPTKLTEFCKIEPWAGHVSGSFYELEFLLELFSQTPDKDGNFDASKAADKDTRNAAIAWGSAFLIATGMHTSIEVALPARTMLGEAIGLFDLSKNKDKLAAALCGKDKALSTAFTVDLHTKFTTKRKLK